MNEKEYIVQNEEIIEMLEKFNNADAKTKEKLMMKIINKVSYLVYSKIKKHRHKNFYEDLLQEGRLGLIKAIQDFDIKRGPNFFKFAIWHINNNIKKFYRWDKRTKIRKVRKNEELEVDVGTLFEEKEGNAILFKEIDNLTNMDKTVITLKFGNMNEYTFEHIGNIFHLSKQRIEQIKCHATEKLQKSIEVKNFFQDGD